MTSYNCLIIVVYCLGVAQPTYGCNLIEDDDLKEFDIEFIEISRLTGLIDEKQNIVKLRNAINNIDTKWPTNSWMFLQEEQIPKKFSVGLMKCHTFVVHVQCLTTAWALRIVSLMLRLMDKIKTETQMSEIKKYTTILNEISVNFTMYIAYRASLFFKLGYALPGWMPRLLILFEEMKVNSCFFCATTEFLNDVNLFLYKTTSNILGQVKLFVKQCKSFSEWAYPYSTYPFIDILEEFKVIDRYYTSIKNSFKIQSRLFSYNAELCKKFLIESWLLITPNNAPSGPDYFRELLTRPDWNYLGIIWDYESNSMSDTNIKKNKIFKSTNKYWKMDMLTETYSSRYGSMNQIRQIYRVMVLRLTLINASDCEYLRDQIEPFLKPENGSQLHLIETKFKHFCGNIGQNVQKAIEYLGGDDFLEMLLPELNIFIQHFGRNGSIIIIGVLEELKSISELLKINATSSHKTRDNRVKTSDKINNNFIFEANRLLDAQLYTQELEKKVPMLDFKIANVMKISINNPWIFALP